MDLLKGSKCQQARRLEVCYGDSDADVGGVASGETGLSLAAWHRGKGGNVCVPAPNSVPSSGGKEAIQVCCIFTSSSCEQKHPWWSPGLAPFAGRDIPRIRCTG